MSRAGSLGPLRIFVGGTFDGLHFGHVFLLNFARRRGLALARQRGRAGVRLTVVVARDESVARIKGRPPHHTQDERRRLVGALDAVDATFVGYRDHFLRSVRRAQPDLIVLGYDQSTAWEQTLRTAGIQALVMRCPPYDGRRLKSSKIRSDIEKRQT